MRNTILVVIMAVIILMICNTIYYSQQKNYNWDSLRDILASQALLLAIFTFILDYIYKNMQVVEKFDTTSETANADKFHKNLTLSTNINGVDFYIALLPSSACISTPSYSKDCPTNFPVLVNKSLMDGEYETYTKQVESVKQELEKTITPDQAIRTSFNYYHLFQLSKIPGPGDRLQLRGFSKIGLDLPDYQLSSAFFNNVVSGEKYTYKFDASTSENLNFLCSASPQNIREKKDIANVEVVLEELEPSAPTITPTAPSSPSSPSTSEPVKKEGFAMFLENFDQNTTLPESTPSVPTPSGSTLPVSVSSPVAESDVPQKPPVTASKVDIPINNFKIGFKIRLTLNGVSIYNSDGSPQTITYYVAKCKDASCIDKNYGVTPTPRICLVPSTDPSILHFNLKMV